MTSVAAAELIELARRKKGVDAKAPMDLPIDLAPALEAFTGWRGLTQYMTRRLKVNAMEELQARMAA